MTNFGGSGYSLVWAVLGREKGLDCAGKGSRARGRSQ